MLPEEVREEEGAEEGPESFNWESVKQKRIRCIKLYLKLGHGYIRRDADRRIGDPSSTFIFSVLLSR